MEKRKLKQIEEYILSLFEKRRAAKLLAKEIFQSTEEYANADLVRAFEDLEKSQRLIVRYTDEGDDWVRLTPEGASRAGLIEFETVEKPEAMPHPPKSST
ncbi:MAG TPA: hypothetical protein VNN73_10825 [Blastocatellia bacterium]|nr:hypothetical protein [Blastocatellia bacterium]